MENSAVLLVSTKQQYNSTNIILHIQSKPVAKRGIWFPNHILRTIKHFQPSDEENSPFLKRKILLTIATSFNICVNWVLTKDGRGDTPRAGRSSLEFDRAHWSISSTLNTVAKVEFAPANITTTITTTTITITFPITTTTRTPITTTVTTTTTTTNFYRHHH